METERMEIPAILPKKLLAWYDEGHRELPWRSNPAPYWVWVSEIMLQQTRVEAVKPYFARFMQVLPTIKDLAEAEEELLMKLWEGLGYYRRVRNLQAAAKEIMKEFDGEMPRSYPLIRSLPGIGEYTAGAIASIAFGIPRPAVDGNVLRVLSRVCEDERDILKQPIKKDMTRALLEIYPKDRAGDFTQSLMELGAMVCVPNGAPKCEECPLNDLCLAHLHGSADIIPVKTAKKPRKVETMTVFLLNHKDKWAVHKRGNEGLLAGLWEFPNQNGFLKEEEAKAQLKEWGIEAGELSFAGKKKHIFTHIEWQMQVCMADCEKAEKTPFLWVTKEQLSGEIALPTAFKKVMK